MGQNEKFKKKNDFKLKICFKKLEEEEEQTNSYENLKRK